jgi:two-component system OmpR family response regulator
MRLLIIEDEDKLRETLITYFREKGIFTDAASDGQDGLYYAHKAYYDVIILDIKLLCSAGLRLRENSGLRETPYLY